MTRYAVWLAWNSGPSIRVVEAEDPMSALLAAVPGYTDDDDDAEMTLTVDPRDEYLPAWNYGDHSVIDISTAELVARLRLDVLRWVRESVVDGMTEWPSADVRNRIDDWVEQIWPEELR